MTGGRVSVPRPLTGSRRVLVTALALFLAANGAGSVGAADGPARPAALAVDVRARDLSFDPARIEVTAGARIDLSVVNVGALPHDIAFHLEGDGSGPASPLLQPGDSALVAFEAPAPGEYLFVCQVHPAEMTGTLLVQAPPEAGGTAAPSGVGDPDPGRPRSAEPTRLLPAAALPLARHPRIDPARFEVTVFASGLPYVTGMQALDDGSLLVAVNDGAGGRFIDSTGKLLRFVDRDADGVADASMPVAVLRPAGTGGYFVHTELPGAVAQMRRMGALLALTTRRRSRSTITLLRAGASVRDPYHIVASMELAFPEEHLHDTYALAVHPTQAPEAWEIYFNVGSRLNAASDLTPIRASGLLDADLVPESVYRFDLADDGSGVTASDLRLIATGLRNAAGLAFHPASGDLYLQDNGIDRTDDPEEALSADEIDVIPASQLGRRVVDFGYPDAYVSYRTGTRVGTRGVPPVVAFQPLDGSEAEGAAEIAFAPPGFPAGLDEGLFVGFHGRYSLAGLENEENPLLYVDLEDRSTLEFVPNEARDVGHLDSLLATDDSLFVADLNRHGPLSRSVPEGVIHLIRALDEP